MQRPAFGMPAKIFDSAKDDVLVASTASLPAPLAGNIISINVAVGDRVEAGSIICILEAMKMETEVRAPNAGHIVSVGVSAGDAVAVGDTLLTLA